MAADVLPDLLAPGLRVVFCGSAVGRASAIRGAYYAGPGNRFWPTLYETGLTPRQLAPAEFPRLLDYGLGLTDMVKQDSGSDQDLPPDADSPERLRRVIARFRPRRLAFVGKRPARVFLGRAVDYGPQTETVGPTAIFVLPSPSGAARRYWDVRWWSQLAAAAAADIQQAT